MMSRARVSPAHAAGFDAFLEVELGRLAIEIIFGVLRKIYSGEPVRVSIFGAVSICGFCQGRAPAALRSVAREVFLMARVGRPRWLRILMITSKSSIAAFRQSSGQAMIFKLPPQFGRRSMLTIMICRS